MEIGRSQRTYRRTSEPPASPAKDEHVTSDDLFGHPSDEQQTVETRNVESHPWGEPIPQHRRVVLADGKVRLARKGEVASAISISRSIPTNENILVDMQPYLGRGLPPIRIETAEAVQAGQTLYGDDDGRVTTEKYGEPVGAAKANALAGSLVTLGPLPASALTTNNRGGRVAAESHSPAARAATLGAHPMSQSTTHRVSAERRWRDRVRALMSVRGINRQQAVRCIVAEDPQLHAEFLAERNAKQK